MYVTTIENDIVGLLVSRSFSIPDTNDVENEMTGDGFEFNTNKPVVMCIL